MRIQVVEGEMLRFESEYASSIPLCFVFLEVFMTRSGLYLFKSRCSVPFLVDLLSFHDFVQKYLWLVLSLCYK